MAGQPKGITRIERFEGLIAKGLSDECWPWIGHVAKKGYCNFLWVSGQEKKQVMAHRASWLLYRGEIPDGMMVCHKCDNRKCVNPEHLFLGSAKDNTRDMMKKGRDWFPKQRNARLTDEQVRTIYLDKRYQRIIAEEYGISKAMVIQIQQRKTYARVTEGLGPLEPRLRGRAGLTEGAKYA